MNREPKTVVRKPTTGKEPNGKYDAGMPACDVHHDCLECPLSACKHDDLGPYREWKAVNPSLAFQRRYQPDRHFSFYTPAGIREIADRANVTERAVHKWIERGKVLITTKQMLYDQGLALGIPISTMRRWIREGKVEILDPKNFVLGDKWES